MAGANDGRCPQRIYELILTPPFSLSKYGASPKPPFHFLEPKHSLIPLWTQTVALLAHPSTIATGWQCFKSNFLVQETFYA